MISQDSHWITIGGTVLVCPEDKNPVSPAGGRLVRPAGLFTQTVGRN